MCAGRFSFRVEVSFSCVCACVCVCCVHVCLAVVLTAWRGEGPQTTGSQEVPPGWCPQSTWRCWTDLQMSAG